ncbi:MAG: Bifunctional protein FolD [Microgenomates group bacterium GW2011_GWC1_43_11]|uniref:Bifunctional protein FolD n=1 Tax=Candidatus Gottesmanbacteria bacterium GW2011_GWB1_44_11c TaxID=1618447 RepID=A0A0G1GTP9_9BACT|nr:MAG: Bifunctional protein FolD [Microgenomates group bacterium GW2011_GWC1_43_11]KKT37995.1 MAG: Bifunctional protein FolD [Candidatus Gottesmanbacteria bacterium GW2011_GWB1_44_11c]
MEVRYTTLMIIDGKQIADEMLQKLQAEVSQLKHKGVTPTLAVILVGDNPESMSYVRQKQKTADSIHVEVRVIRYPQTVSQAIINKTIEQCNNDSHIHGIIIQRPLPEHLQDPQLLNSIDPSKDVDGFVPGSKFNVPVALATEKILEQIYKFQILNDESMQQLNNPLRLKPISEASETMKQFFLWLKKQHVVVIGRGETGGKPIAEYLIQQGCNVSVVHSQTSEEEKQRVLKNADIIISCVGKKSIVTPDIIKKGVILISIGISKGDDGILHGDYEEDEIKHIASFYTPTPGGVGPVNVACLMENLVTSASLPL